MNKDLKTFIAIKKLVGGEKECCGCIYTWNDFIGFKNFNEKWIMMELISPTYPQDIEKNFIFFYHISSDKIFDGFNRRKTVHEALIDLDNYENSVHEIIRDLKHLENKI